MAKPKIDLHHWISRIPEHLEDLPHESSSPIKHYKRGANDSWNLLRYVERTAGGYAAPRQRHLSRLRSLVVLSLVETFERFVKELAAVCVKHVGPLVLDDRLSVLRVRSQSVAAHFEENDLGKALTEGDTWLDCDKISERFRSLLAPPFEKGNFSFFPSQKTDPDYWRRETMGLLWQLRHSIVHNVGVITRSDASKLRLLRRSPVDAPKLLSPKSGDVWYVKLFLDETAAWSNDRVAKELVDLLATIHEDDTSLFVPAERAIQIAKEMNVPVSIGGAAATP